MSGIKEHSNDNLILALQNGEDRALDQFYRKNKVQFITWAEKQFGISGEDGIDIYQNAVIAFYENAVAGRIKSEKAELSTYLFAIAKNMIRKYYRNLTKNKADEPIEDNLLIDWDKPENEDQGKLLFVEKALGEMKDGCRSILRMYYYQNRSLDDIATLLGHKDKQVTKTQKSRCLKYLKDQVKGFSPTTA